LVVVVVVVVDDVAWTFYSSKLKNFLKIVFR